MHPGLPGSLRDQAGQPPQPGETLEFEAPLPEDMQQLLKLLRERGGDSL